MKLSISLSAQEVAALDRFVTQTGLESRSAGIQQAIRRLPDPEIEDAYAAAWDEWASSSDADLWESTAGDGVGDAAR